MKIKRIISSLLIMALLPMCIAVNAEESIDFNADNNKQSVEFMYINSDFGGMEFSVSIENEDGDIVYADQIKSTLGGKVEALVNVAPGSYKLEIFPMGAKRGYSKMFYIFSEAQLDNLWTIVTTSDDYDEISQNWPEIKAAFGFEISTETGVVALSKVLAQGLRDFGEREAKNISKFKIYLSNSELLAQLSACGSKSDAEALELLKATYPLLEAYDAEKYASLKAEFDSLGEPVAAIYKAKANTAFTAQAVVDILEDSILEVKKDKVVDDLNALTHTSLIKAFVTNEENAELLGITDLVEEYEDLNSTDSVDSAVQGKGFKNAGEFVAAFSAAIETAKKQPVSTDKDKRPSYSSGGGGSSSFGVISSNPVDIPKTNEPVVESNGSATASFTDLSGYEWAAASINTLSSKGILSGRGNGIFAPGDLVTRAEFAKILVSVLGLSAVTGENPFADVSDSDWFAEFALVAYANNIILGSDGNFMPHSGITRQDAAVMIFRALGKAANGSLAFTDADAIAPYAQDAVATLGSEGIIAGMDDGSFAPLSGLTRAQAAVLLSRIMEVK